MKLFFKTVIIFILIIIVIYFSYKNIETFNTNDNNDKSDIYKYKGPYSLSNKYTFFKNNINFKLKKHFKQINNNFKPFNDKILYYYNKYI